MSESGTIANIPQPVGAAIQPHARLKISYVAPFLDPSGYAEFARCFVRALHQAGVSMQLEAKCFDRSRPNLGDFQQIYERYSDHSIAPNLRIVNLQPECFPMFRKAGMINLGFTMFETTRIPRSWVEECNRMDGILVPCQWNRDVFESSGVTVPVRVVAPGIDVRPASKCPTPLEAARDLSCRRLRLAAPENDLPSRALHRLKSMCLRTYRSQPALLSDWNDCFKFYSIFQWTERKCPDGLIRAYFAEFRADEKVCLVLKTYGQNFSYIEQRRIEARIADIRESMRLEDHPPIAFVPQLLSSEEIENLHRACDCFVLPHRAEGFGMPHLEAMAAGNPVITTAFSGNMDFTTPENSYLIPYQLTPVCKMPWVRWFEADMLWAEPDLAALRRQMRTVFEHPHDARSKGRAAQSFVQEQFNWEFRTAAFLNVLSEWM